MPDDVPDVVLEELLAAFSDDRTPRRSTSTTRRSIGCWDSTTRVDDDDDQTAPADDDRLDDTAASPTVAPSSRQPAQADRDRRRRPPRRRLPRRGVRLSASRRAHRRRRESGGRSTIVIKDLDESGSIEALPARSSGSMDPRVRARRIAVRRAKGRKRLIWVAIAAAILAGAGRRCRRAGVVAVRRRTVDVQGAVYTDPDAAVGDRRRPEGRPVLLVDTRRDRAPAREHRRGWSRRGSRHDFPHTVFIDIRERKPSPPSQGPTASTGSSTRRPGARRPRRQPDRLHADHGRQIPMSSAVSSPVGRSRRRLSWRSPCPAEIRSLTESIGVDADRPAT